MDNFYSSMKDILSSSDLETSSSLAASSSMFPNTLVPVNSCHWTTYDARSIIEIDIPEFGDKIKIPFENVRVASEYVKTSQSDVQWRARF